MAVVAEDEVLARRLRTILASSGLEPVAVVASAEELPATAHPDVIVQAGHLDAAALAGRIDASVVGIVPAVEARQLRGALAAGVLGIVREADVDACLVEAVRAVATGQLVLPGEAVGKMSRPMLSGREKQVMSLVVIGFSNPEIARKLHIAETTVKSHLTSSFRKLGVRTRSEATARILDPATGLGLGILAVTDAALGNVRR